MPVSLSAFTGKYSYLNNVSKRSIQSGSGILQDIGDLSGKQAGGCLSGEGVGRQRVNEPMFGVRLAPVPIPRTFQDDAVPRSSRVTEYGNVRTTPLITTQKFKEPASARGTSSTLGVGEVIMPGDELKMSLLKKLARKKKKVREAKPEHKVSLNIVKEKKEKSDNVLKLATTVLFPLLFKKIDPKGADVLKDKKKRTKVFTTLEKTLKKSAKKPEFDKDTADKIGDVFAKIFGQMSINITPDAKKALKIDILSGLFKLKAGMNLNTQSGGSKKSRKFWKDFGGSFLKTLKVGLPIAAIIAPELAPVALAAELLL